MNKTDKIFVAGHTGLIGSAVARRLQNQGYDNLLLAGHAELELTDAVAVDRFFDEHSPDYVVLAAGRVGGIIENQTYPADFMNANLAIQLNVLKAAHRSGVQKLILFASSCMYPRECPQPMAETALLSGHPEPTSLAYAISKLAGMQMCLAYNKQYGEQRFIPVIPNSAFGPNDNFDPKSGHVLSSLIRRFHEAQQTGVESLTLWGSGTPRREFIHTNDIADACIALLTGDTTALELPLNLGTGRDFSIRELAETIAGVIGYSGTIEWDTSKPDGAPRKLLDSSRLRAFGWQPAVNFEEGVKDTYQWYLDNALSTETRS
ncbi:GDP-L-fucose synthase [Methylobacter sp. Wu8]|uniref:GDP-L-fucose synthase n=1 Tax=Methylobacter tundripaludum TaxID=173365 RepID=A0A2S6H2A5_9GAMM|nr:GDP-L-fucose synthase [Methylobacter tundripaludum]MCF7964453.1 GDP-L-fucose synthase [Methylobacter tundripaludum]MCK9637937.1 GDP-L-fucose synthase [Methylobacter tundripaludum]PPK71557.1 GDP-L-fucose synthase [Methylobacter tundripaludum]